MFSYRQAKIFMEDRNCWPVWIYCSTFVTIVKKESQIFYDTLYRCLKKTSFLLKKPTSLFTLGWLIIKASVFLSGIYDNGKWVFWNSFTRKGFLKTDQATSVKEFSTVNGWTIPFQNFLSLWQQQLFVGERISTFLDTMVATPNWCNQNQEKNTFLFYF